MKKLGMGVLGVGEMGRRHAENLRYRVPEAKLIAVADVSEARAKQVASELELERYYGSFEAMLEDKEIEAVLIATPDKFHAKCIQLAAHANKDILCEKPLAVNIPDGKATLDAVAKSGKRLQIGFMRRYDPAYAAAMKRIEAGEIGTPVIFKSVGRDKDQPPIAAYESNVNGMMFYNNTIHDFDLARWMMRDEVSNVQAFTTCAIRPEVAKFGDVVASVVNLQYRHGAIGNIESYAQAVYAYDVRTEIVGSKGSIFVGTIGAQEPAVLLTSRGGEQRLEDHFLTRFADAYLNEVRDFVHTMLKGDQPRVTGDDGLKALAIAAAAEESHRHSKPVAISG